MFLNSLIEELCTKEEINKAGWTLSFGGQRTLILLNPNRTFTVHIVKLFLIRLFFLNPSMFIFLGCPQNINESASSSSMHPENNLIKDERQICQQENLSGAKVEEIEK